MGITSECKWLVIIVKISKRNQVVSKYRNVAKVLFCVVNGGDITLSVRAMVNL